jgi:hypothetical protein
VYKVDTGLIELSNAMAALEEQAAKELGQWVDRSSSENVNIDLVTILNEGRQREREAFERRQREARQREAIEASTGG